LLRKKIKKKSKLNLDNSEKELCTAKKRKMSSSLLRKRRKSKMNKVKKSSE